MTYPVAEVQYKHPPCGIKRERRLRAEEVLSELLPKSETKQPDSQGDCGYKGDENENDFQLAFCSYPESKGLVDEHAGFECLKGHHHEWRPNVSPRMRFQLGERERHDDVPSVPGRRGAGV